MPLRQGCCRLGGRGRIVVDRGVGGLELVERGLAHRRVILDRCVVVAQPFLVVGQSAALLGQAVELGLLAADRLPALRQIGERLMHFRIEFLGRDVDAELAVLELGDQICMQNLGGALSPELHERLRQHFSDAEILELGVVAAMLTGWTKLMFTFDLVTREDSCPIG